MTKIFGICSILIFLISCSSDKRQVDIVFNANPPEDSVKYWEVYAEHRPTPYGFIIVDSNEYTEQIQPFFIGKFYNDSLATVKLSINIKKEYIVIGIIANNGIRSLITASPIIKLNEQSNTVWIK